MLFFIGTLKSQEGTLYRLFDTEDKSKQDIEAGVLRDSLVRDNIVINNIGIGENGKIIGTCGRLERYAVLNLPMDEVKQRPIVITARKANKYYVVDILGNCKVMDYKEAVSYCENAGIANAKVVKRGNRNVLSAISGTFDTGNGGRLSDEIDEYYNKCLKLREEGKLDSSQLGILSQIEKIYLKRMHNLRVKEQHGLAGAIEIAMVTPIIDKLAKIETAIEDRSICGSKKKLKRQLSECNGRVKVLCKAGVNADDIGVSLCDIKEKYHRSDQLYSNCEINSEEYLRRLSILSNSLDNVLNYIVGKYPLPRGDSNA